MEPVTPRSSRAQEWFARTILPVGLATPALLPWLWPVSPTLAVGLIVGSHLPVFYGTFLPNRQSFGPVITGFAGAPNEVWLTIDDGPDPRDTPRILAALEAFDAHATFFVRGDRAAAHPQLVEAIVRAGHTVGNHTYSHPQRSFWRLPPSRIGAEMDGCNAVLRRITGAPARWFRAPVGMINPFVHRAAHQRGMRVIGWSARAYDAGRNSRKPPAVLSRIQRGLKSGGIVLLHEGIPAAAENVTNLLALLHTQGFRAVIPRDADL